MVGERGQFHVRASKGIHILVPRDRIQSTTGVILRTERSVLFVIPWGRHWVIGTTDTDWNLDKAHPAATRADIDYLLDEVNGVLTTALTGDDVERVYAGLRPLLAGESESTSKLDAHQQAEVDVYLQRVAAERKSQTMPDDESADATRLTAPEIGGHRTASRPGHG